MFGKRTEDCQRVRKCRQTIRAFTAAKTAGASTKSSGSIADRSARTTQNRGAGKSNRTAQDYASIAENATYSVAVDVSCVTRNALIAGGCMKNLFEVTFIDASTTKGNEDVWIMCDEKLAFPDALARWRRKKGDHRTVSYWRNHGPLAGESV